MFNSPEGSLEEIFVNDYDMIDQYAKTGSLWVWGGNNVGQLGDGTTTDRSSPVQTVAAGTNWKQVSKANWGAAIKTDGTLWTWGQNTYGVLGDNTAVDKSSPVQTVAGGTNWKEISPQIGWESTAAIKTDGTLWLWGRNRYGTLGDNTAVDKSSPVQTIAGGTNWKQVSTGNTTGAIKTDGTLWLWGVRGSGELGDNTNSGAPRSSPVQTISGGTNWKQVSCGGVSSVGAIKTDGTLWTWGYNTEGELGDGTRTPRSSPVQTIAGGTNWKQVSCGGYSMAAIKTDGTLWTWGWNGTYYGQLGDGTTTSRSSPVQTISGGTNWKQVYAGYTIMSTIKTDGTLWTWGDNGSAALGDGTTTSRSSPVQTISGGTNWKQVSGFLYGAGIYFYDAGNLYPGGGGGGGPFSATISSSQSDLNLRTWALANGWDGSSAATITVGSSAVIYSTDNTTAALIINGAWPGGVTVINTGIIMGKGGSGYPATAGAGGAGPAISLGINVTITNSGGVIAGGGGAGQAGYTYINSNWGYANTGGGGGAGGGTGGGGWFSGGTYGLVQTSYGGASGGVGSSGGNATANMPGIGGGAGGGGGGYYSGTGGSLTAGGGGGGGRVNPVTATGGLGANSTSYAGGGQKISGDGGSNGSVGGNYLTTLGAGGGGGYGAAGGTGNGTGPYGGGGAGGKAIALNGYTASYTDSGSTYGSVS